MSHMISLFDGKSSNSPVRTRGAAERVHTLLSRATRCIGEGLFDQAEEAFHAAQAILEQQAEKLQPNEDISILDHLHALIVSGRIYGARGNHIAALATYKKVAEQLLDHAGILDTEDPETAELFKLHEYLLVEARNAVAAEQRERMVS